MVQCFLFVNIVFYYSYFHLFLWDKVGVGIKPVEWYVLTLALGVAVYLKRFQLICRGWGATRLIAWAACLLFYAGVSCVTISGGEERALEALFSLGESLVLMVLFVVLFQYEKAHHAGGWAVLVAVVVGVITNVVEFGARGLIVLSAVPGRSAGFYENANMSGNYLVMGMALSLWMLPKQWRSFYCLLVALGVFVTFSRSSLMMWALAMVLVAWFRGFHVRRAFSVSVVAMFLIVAGATLVEGRWGSYLSDMGLGEYLDANTSARIAGSFVEQADHSSRERALVARRGFERFLDAPVFGNGIGAATSPGTGVSTHNQYLHMAVEFGLIGALLLIAVIWLLWRTGTAPARVTSALYAFSCLFTHNNLEGPAIAVVLSLAATLVVADRETLGRGCRSRGGAGRNDGSWTSAHRGANSA